MKICQINCVYGSGSTGSIVEEIHTELIKRNIRSIVIVPKTKSKDKGVYTVSNRLLNDLSAFYRRFFGRQFDGAFVQTNRILNILKKEKPDIVHLHCINGNDINVYRLMNYLSSNKIKTVLTLHAEFPYTGGCAHAYSCQKWLDGCGDCYRFKKATNSWIFDRTARTWKKQKDCFGKFDDNKLVIVSVSPWLNSRAGISPMLTKFKKIVILNGCDTSIFYPRKTNNWREKLNISPDKIIVAHITASFNPDSNDSKGGRFIYQLAEQCKNDNIVFVVAANSGKVDTPPDNLLYVGRAPSAESLAELYSEASCTVVTSKRETFSMVLAESICCGTPVVAFKAGGPESISVQDFTDFAEYGDIEELYKKLMMMVEEHHNRQKIEESGKNKYDKSRMVSEYINEYFELFNCADKS